MDAEQQQRTHPNDWPWMPRMQKLGRFVGVDIQQMYNDSLVETPHTVLFSKYNRYLVTTRKGRSVLARRHLLTCSNNPFNIAALFIACKRLRLRNLDSKTACALRDDIIDEYLKGYLADHIYMQPVNDRLMQMALEKFKANYTAGVGYGDPIAVLLW
jgi:hypothetical protein